MPTNDFRTILARATREAHERVERLLALGPDASLARYMAYLRTMHSVVARAEAAFDRDTGLRALDLAPSRKRDLLERDLAYFRLEPLAYDEAMPHDLPSLVGWAYVLEGAALGARVLHARLAPRWSLEPDSGGAFLAGQGTAAETWRRFVHALNRARFGEEERKACIAGARQAFAAIEERFRASVAGVDLGLGQHDRPAAATPPEQAADAAIDRTNADHREERFGER